MTWLEKLLAVMSPQLAELFKQGLAELLQKLYIKALETPNSWDDISIKVIAQVVGVELTEPE